MPQFEVCADFGIASRVNSICQKVAFDLGSYHRVQSLVDPRPSSGPIFERLIWMIVTASAKIVVLLNGHKFSIPSVETLNRVVKRCAAIMCIHLTIENRRSRTFLGSADTSCSSCLRSPAPISARFSCGWLENWSGHPRIVDGEQSFVLRQLVHVHQIFSAQKVSAN